MEVSGFQSPFKGPFQVLSPFASGFVTVGKLTPVPGHFASMTSEVLLYYPSYRQIMPKLRAFIDHVKSHWEGITRPGFTSMIGAADHGNEADALGATPPNPA
jgi:hypothetical protein